MTRSKARKVKSGPYSCEIVRFAQSVTVDAKSRELMREVRENENATHLGAKAYDDVLAKYPLPALDAVQDAPQNQIESKPTIAAEGVESELKAAAIDLHTPRLSDNNDSNRCIVTQGPTSVPAGP